LLISKRLSYKTVPWARTYQYALVHVAIVAELDADPDDAGVVHLSVVEGQGGHGERALMAGDQVRVS